MSHLQLNTSGKGKARIFLGLAFFTGCLCTYLLLPNPWLQTPAPEIVRQDLTCDYIINRVNGFDRVKPVLSVERQVESPQFNVLKMALSELIDSLRRTGMTSQASVYLREFDQGEWFSVNKEEEYHPASLMKVALLLCYLKVAESNPAMLQQKWLYAKNKNQDTTPQFYTAPSIQAGKKYSLHELLYYMIAYSDNNATELLASRSDKNQLEKLFASFGLSPPVEDKARFTLNADTYSVFIKAIYNSAYLSPEFSEYAAELLSNCTFKEGFVKGIPDDTKIWHKFGEWRSAGHDYELHEAGVFFVKEKPFLLTVMTRGKDTPKLAETISAIARKVYEKVSPP